MNAHAQSIAQYKVLPGTLHKKGIVSIAILPNESSFNVKMDFEVKKKPFVPVPNQLLKGSKVYQFPDEFKTEAGYKDLEHSKSLMIPKAELKFIKRGSFGHLTNAYFIQVLPTNKKTKIDIIYHPSLPSVGWAQIMITFLSKIPLLDGYKLQGEFVK